MNCLSQVPNPPFRERKEVHRLPMHRDWRHLCPHSFHTGLCVNEHRYNLNHVDNYYKSNFPTDSDGEPCSYGKNADYAFVYFPDINDISKVR